MTIVRWGLLSTANINRRLIPAIRASERGELVAVASRSQESADAYAARWDIPRAFGSYEAMLESADVGDVGAVDAVYIGLPNSLHAEWTIRSLECGKHVLCEKPFALTLDEVDRMTAAARERGLALAEAFMYRHHPQTKIAGQMVQDGRLGEIVLVRGVFNFRLASRHGLSLTNVRLRPEMGGGCLWDVGCYPVSLAQYMAGSPPVSVFGEQWIGPTGIDETFNGQLRYENGALAQISSSFRNPFYTHVDILGTEGRLVMTRPFIGVNEPESEMIFTPADGKPEAVAVPDMELYLGEIEDMHAAILDGRANYLTLEETRNHIRTLLALYESSRRGEQVNLEEFV
jgi:predicted dehydrogenase